MKNINGIDCYCIKFSDIDSVSCKQDQIIACEPDCYDYYLSILNKSEIERANKFCKEIDKINFVIARANLRIFLSKYTSIHPQKIEFFYSANGKPYIQTYQNKLQFNLSHTKKFAAYAFSLDGRKVGIDIEYLDSKINLLKLAKRFFGKNEYAFLSNLNQAEVINFFYKLWCRKEAYIKCIDETLGYLNFIPCMLNTLKDEVFNNAFILKELEIVEDHIGVICYFDDYH